MEALASIPVTARDGDRTSRQSNRLEVDSDTGEHITGSVVGTFAAGKINSKVSPIEIVLIPDGKKIAQMLHLNVKPRSWVCFIWQSACGIRAPTFTSASSLPN